MRFPFSLNRFITLFLSPFLFLNLTHSRPLLPTNVTVLTREDFNGTYYYTVADALSGLASINLQKDGYKGSKVTAKIRGGSSSNQVLFLMDGRPLTHDFNSEVDLEQIPLQMVERIEISRGGGSLSYGAEGIGGVVNIITTRPQKKELNVRVGSGVGRDGVKQSKGRFKGRSYYGDWTYAVGVRNSSGYTTNEELDDATNHFVNLSRSFNGNGYIGLEYYFQESDVGVGQGTLVPISQWNRRIERVSANSLFRRENENQHGKIVLASPEVFGGHVRANYVQSQRKREELTFRAGPAFVDEDTRTKTADTNWTKGNFEFGGRWQSFERKLFPNQTNKTRQSGTYIQNTFQGNSWAIKPSVRYDHHSNFGGITNPHLVFILSPTEAMIFSATASRGFRVPTYDEFFIGGFSSANPDLDPEVAWSYDTGIKIQKGSFHVSGTGFFSRVEDLILADNTNRLNNSAAVEENMGAETTVGLKLGEKNRFFNLHLQGNWTFQRSRQDLKNGLGFVPTRLTPRHLAFARLNHTFPKRIRISNEVHYQSEQFEFNNRLGTRLPSHYVWDFRLLIKVLAADLYFDVLNVTQRRYADNIGSFTSIPGGVGITTLLPQPERTFLAGFSIKFIN